MVNGMIEISLEQYNTTVHQWSENKEQGRQGVTCDSHGDQAPGPRQSGLCRRKAQSCMHRELNLPGSSAGNVRASVPMAAVKGKLRNLSIWKYPMCKCAVKDTFKQKYRLHLLMEGLGS